ncbi:MAG: hypothetical protein V4525_08095 [Pseudomonadota bacterium]
MNSLLKLCVTLFSYMFLASWGFASTQYSARVISLNTYQAQTNNGNAGVVFFTLEGSRTPGTSIPACAGTSIAWAVNNTNPDVAKAQIAMLTMALAQGRPINVFGTSECNQSVAGSSFGVEVVLYLWMTP